MYLNRQPYGEGCSVECSGWVGLRHGSVASCGLGVYSFNCLRTLPWNAVKGLVVCGLVV